MSWESVISPMMEIELLDVAGHVRQALTKQPEGLIMTSRHAVFLAESAPELRKLPLYVVGEATAKAAREQGFTIMKTAENALALSAEITLTNMLYLSGEEVQHDFAQSLSPKGISVDRIVVYRSVAASRFTPEAIAAFESKQLQGVLFFSAHTVKHFHQIADLKRLSELTAYCLSESVAAACREAGSWQEIRIADNPTQESLIKTLVK